MSEEGIICEECGSYPSPGLDGPPAEWTSVKDRLPEVGSAVIAAMRVEEERDRFEGWWFGCCIYREYGFPWVKFDNPHPIEYWMPLDIYEQLSGNTG